MALSNEDVERLYRAHAAEVLRFLACRVLLAEVAVDLLSETFAQAYRDRRSCRGDSDEVALGWIYGIARHSVAAYQRRGVVERQALNRLGFDRRPLEDFEYERIEELAGRRHRPRPTRMSSPPATHTVLNPDIKPRTMARLLGLHDLERGVVVCHPVPPQVRTDHLARDVLYALGKHPSIPGWPGSRVTAERLSVTWLLAEQITDVLLVRADLFTPSTLVDLIELNRAAGARTWLAFDSPRAHRHAKESLGASPAARVRIKPRDAQTSTLAEGARARCWRTPSPWIARAAAACLLPADQLDWVDARIRTGFEVTSQWLKRARLGLTPATTERFLEFVTGDFSSQYRYARRLGANSALLQYGFASEILDRKARRVIVMCDPTYAQAREIRRHSNPASAALKTLALFTDLDVEMLGYLTLDQLTPTPSGVLVGRYHMKGAGAAALRAHAALQIWIKSSTPGRLFTIRQLSDHFSANDQTGRTAPRTLKVKLAKLPDSLNSFDRQPDLADDFDTPTVDMCDEASLILRLLRLSRSKALPVTDLTTTEREAGQRLAAVHVAKMDNDHLAATDHLLFSQFRMASYKYVATGLSQPAITGQPAITAIPAAIEALLDQVPGDC